MNRKVLCTICARGGSKGVANKNIKLLLGKPMIAYSIEVAIDCGIFSHIVVSTDSDEIANVAIRYGGEVFFRRPLELAGDTVAKVPVIRHALISSEEYFRERYDTVVDLDTTSPLRIKDDIIESLKKFYQEGWDNLITAMPARRSPYFNLIEQGEGGKVVLSKHHDHPPIRRQDSPKCYDMNASIYIWKRECLMANDNVIIGNTGLFVMPEERSIDIDTELDFRFVEFLMKSRLINGFT